MRKKQEIEIRSEDVQEVMSQIPPWIVRWGITILFMILLGVLIGSFFFKYPDVIITEMTLSSKDPVAHVVARNFGRMLHLYVENGEMVKEKQMLGVLENPAEMEYVLILEENLNRVGRSLDKALSLFLSYRPAISAWERCRGIIILF
ncbi:MAG: hypothetical protein LUE93_12795 [Bacteroides sp.]|nr:hypothetical protein [Bacteroides sp.]